MLATVRPTLLLGLLLASPALAQTPGRFAGDGIVIGLEYALADTERATVAKAKVFAETGMPGMKNIGEAVAWGAMQAGPTAPINYDKVDWFVREYQRNGFTDLTLPLKPHCRWGSKDSRLLKTTNPTPKPQYVEHFKRWVGGIVERYDADGVDDMPGLRWPVRVVEIGTEFSSYEPEPVAQYLAMLEIAYKEAHRVYPEVVVTHAAFLTTPVDLDVARPADYPRVWRETKRHDTHHEFKDLQAVLDRPDLFDVINLHNLGSPYEIEHQMRWLAWEMRQRNYRKRVIISDTLPTSYIAWGPATTCKGNPLGILIPPATEADRCRLAAFFTKLVDKKPATLAWTRGFVAADHVQRAIIATEQGIERINLSFVADLPFLTSKWARAGAGISAWAGATRQNPRTGRVFERYPLFHAIRQLMGHLTGYRSIERVEFADPAARVYRVEGRRGPFWVAWHDPQGVLLPADGSSQLGVALEINSSRAVVERVITGLGQTVAESQQRQATGGVLEISLTHTPVFVVPNLSENLKTSQRLVPAAEEEGGARPRRRREGP